MRNFYYLLTWIYESIRYAMDLPSSNYNIPGGYEMRRSEIRFNTGLNKQLSKWVWMEAKIGYVHYFETEIEGFTAQTDQASYYITPGDGVFFKISLFLSPPKELLRCKR